MTKQYHTWPNYSKLYQTHLDQFALKLLNWNHIPHMYERVHLWNIVTSNRLYMWFIWYHVNIQYPYSYMIFSLHTRTMQTLELFPILRPVLHLQYALICFNDFWSFSKILQKMLVSFLITCTYLQYLVVFDRLMKYIGCSPNIFHSFWMFSHAFTS